MWLPKQLIIYMIMFQISSTPRENENEMVIDSDVNESETPFDNISTMNPLSLHTPCLSVDYRSINHSLMTPDLRLNGLFNAYDNQSLYQF